jgi:hypothetical protein
MFIAYRFPNILLDLSHRLINFARNLVLIHK